MEEWYKIRDLFFGENYQIQNIEKAFELARTCKHKEAVWFLENEEVLKSLKKPETTDKKILFYWFHKTRSPNIKHCYVAEDDYIACKFGDLNYGTNERDMHYHIGYFMSFDDHLFKAVKLGHLISYLTFSKTLKHDNPLKWILIESYMKKTKMRFTLKEDLLIEKIPYAWFTFGRFISKYYFGHVDNENTRRGMRTYRDTLDSIYETLLCLGTLGIYKDLRILIGKTIFDNVEWCSERRFFLDY